jgi:hypothetical protein
MGDQGFAPYKDESMRLAEALLQLCLDSETTSIQTVFRDPDDGESPIGVVFAAVGNPEHIQALLDVITLANANHEIRTSERFKFDPPESKEPCP